MRMRVVWSLIVGVVVGALLLLFVWQRLSHQPQPAAPPELAAPAPGLHKSTLLPPGEEPEAVVILQKNDDGVMAPVLLGQLRSVPIEEEGQPAEKPDPLRPGNILIVRDLDEQVAKDLKVTNGSLQVAGAYIARAQHELEYLGQVDLNKRNKRLALEFGIQPPAPTPTPSE